jgi:hypothetical protein
MLAVLVNERAAPREGKGVPGKAGCTWIGLGVGEGRFTPVIGVGTSVASAGEDAGVVTTVVGGIDTENCPQLRSSIPTNDKTSALVFLLVFIRLQYR